MQNLQGRYLFQLETGSGKTALSYTIACHYACNGHRVLIVNESEELTFRDYKKAEESCKQIEIQVNFDEGKDDKILALEGITYLSFWAFMAFAGRVSPETLENIIVLCDEVDSIIFGSEEMVLASLNLFPKLRLMIGITGSNLKDFHVKNAVRLVDGVFVKMNIADVLKPPP